MDEKKFKSSLKKYAIRYDEKSDTYYKKFFITNTSSVDKSDELLYDVVGMHLDANEIVKGDFVDITLVHWKENFAVFSLHGRESGYIGLVSFTISEFDMLDFGSYYKNVSMDIAKLLQDKGFEEGFSDIKVSYNLWMIRETCMDYIAGCEFLKDEIKAIDYMKDRDCIKEQSEEFRKCDVLLLYSAYALGVINKRLDIFTRILKDYDLDLKGLMYAKNSFYEINGDNPYVNQALFSLDGEGKALYINVGIDTKKDFYKRVVKAVEAIHEVMGIKPTIYAGVDMLSEVTRDHIEDGIDYTFIKGITKSSLLFDEVSKYPERYIGNYKHNISMSDYCASFYSGVLEIETYRLDEHKFSVYVNRHDWSFKDNYNSCYTVDISKFTKEEINFAIASVDQFECEILREDNIKYKEQVSFAMSADNREDLNSSLAGLIALYYELYYRDELLDIEELRLEGEYYDEEEYEYPEEISLKEKLKNEIKEVDIHDSEGRDGVTQILTLEGVL